MKIIMISGKARSGKDTLADFLFKEFEEKEKPCRVQISQYIKYYAQKYFGWDGEEESKPRDLLNYLGTEIIRNKINPDFHINRLIEDIEVLSYFYDVFIISDVRFPEEIKKVKEKYDNVITIRINRDSNELNSNQKSNITETALDEYEDYDYFIDNNKTLEALKEKALSIFKEVGEQNEWRKGFKR